MSPRKTGFMFSGFKMNLPRKYIFNLSTCQTDGDKTASFFCFCHLVLEVFICVHKYIDFIGIHKSRFHFSMARNGRGFFSSGEKMKYRGICCAAASMLTVLFSSAALADSSDCTFIRNNDQKSMCRALTKKDSSECTFIRNDDKKSMCRALTKNDSSECTFIRNDDLKYMCKALTKKDSSECTFIRGDDLKYMCKALIKKDSSECTFIRDDDLKYMCKGNL